MTSRSGQGSGEPVRPPAGSPTVRADGRPDAERPVRRGPGRPVKHTGAVRRVVTDARGREREQRWERVNVILTEEVDRLDALADERLARTGYRPSRSDLLRAFTRAILAAEVDLGDAATERQIQRVLEEQLRAGGLEARRFPT